MGWATACPGYAMRALWQWLGRGSTPFRDCDTAQPRHCTLQRIAAAGKSCRTLMIGRRAATPCADWLLAWSSSERETQRKHVKVALHGCERDSRISRPTISLALPVRPTLSSGTSGRSARGRGCRGRPGCRCRHHGAGRGASGRGHWGHVKVRDGRWASVQPSPPPLGGRVLLTGCGASADAEAHCVLSAVTSSGHNLRAITVAAACAAPGRHG